MLSLPFFYATAHSVLICPFRTFFPWFYEWYLQTYTWILKFNFGLVVLQLDIVQRQYINQAGLNQADLVKVVFSAQGKWLATVEEREEVTDPELQLKLWFYDEETQR